MDSFDYLTYKQNKQQAIKAAQTSQREKRIFYWLCLITFCLFFVFAMKFIASKSSKIDIEYGKFANNSEQIFTEEETPPNERFTIDKRLFIIQQEEKAPRQSYVAEKINQGEVISSNEFEQIKNNNLALDEPKEEINTEVRIEETPVKIDTPANEQPEKIVMKPKIAEAPAAKPIGALDLSTVQSKVMIGKFSTPEEARVMLNSVADTIEGASPFVKKIGNVYTVQAGSYDNFETAKTMAFKLKAKGLEVWIFQ